jgi:hypothetical protein
MFLRYSVSTGFHSERHAPPADRRDHEVHGDSPYRRVPTMVIIAVFALLVLFSIISIVMSAGDPERSNTSRENRENPLLWATLGRR